MGQYFEAYSKIIYFAIAIALMLLALVTVSVWSLTTGLLMGTRESTVGVLRSVGLIIVNVFVWLSSKADALMSGESAAAEAEKQDEGREPPPRQDTIRAVPSSYREAIAKGSNEYIA